MSTHPLRAGMCGHLRQASATAQAPAGGNARFLPQGGVLRAGDLLALGSEQVPGDWAEVRECAKSPPGALFGVRRRGAELRPFT